MHRGYKVRLYPNKEQAIALDNQLGCARWVYNEMIKINQKKYHRTGKSLSGYDMQSYLPKLKKQYPWLKDAPAQSLQIVCHNLADAYGKFFKKNGGYPKFKKRGCYSGFACLSNIGNEGSKIKIPKLNPIKYRGGDCPVGKLKKITISKSAGKYFASLMIEVSEQELPLQEPNNILGVDLGLKDFVVTSDGQAIKPSKYTRKYQVKLKRAQQTLARRKKGSNRRRRARLAVALIHEKIRNSRKDFNHKVSRQLVDSENQAIAVENLNVKGMMANHRLAKSIADAGWSQFLTLLKYKANAVGKPVLEVGRFFPSSKTCSACGVVNNSLTLSQRQWACGGCGISHHRDINAALNIALEAARNVVRGDGVIPDVMRQVIVCEA